MKSIVVFGGSGFVGRSLCRLLSADGNWRVRVVTRRLLNASALAGLPNVSLVEADISDPQRLHSVLEGQDAVVNLIAILHGTPRKFSEVHVDWPRRLAMACLAAGTRRFLHVSALGVESPEPSLYARSKADGEAALRSILPTCTVLRPSVMFGEEDRFLNTFERIQRLAPFVPLAGSDARFQPVWVEDVAQALAKCLDEPSSAGRTYECTGPSVYTLADLVRLAGKRGRVQRPILPLPSPLAMVQAWVMEHLPGEPLMSRDNLRSMRSANIATPGAPNLADLGIKARSLEEFLAG
jgi:uncharacterized protein YbjT (DUF2867 family)